MVAMEAKPQRNTVSRV